MVETASHTPTLYREIDALSGTAANDLERGYVSAITDVLAILERRGFSEAADAGADLLGAFVRLYEAGRTAWHFQHQNTNAQFGFATALTQARAAIAKATGASHEQ